jgi:hypothetical protein
MGHEHNEKVFPIHISSIQATTVCSMGAGSLLAKIKEKWVMMIISCNEKLNISRSID